MFFTYMGIWGFNLALIFIYLQEHWSSCHSPQKSSLLVTKILNILLQMFNGIIIIISKCTFSNLVFIDMGSYIFILVFAKKHLYLRGMEFLTIQTNWNCALISLYHWQWNTHILYGDISVCVTNLFHLCHSTPIIRKSYYLFNKNRIYQNNGKIII